jgi:hypothetical protein
MQNYLYFGCLENRDKQTLKENYSKYDLTIVPYIHRSLLLDNMFSFFNHHYIGTFEEISYLYL